MPLWGDEQALDPEMPSIVRSDVVSWFVRSRFSLMEERELLLQVMLGALRHRAINTQSINQQIYGTL